MVDILEQGGEVNRRKGQYGHTFYCVTKLAVSNENPLAAR
jgi:hypothetical protein